MAKHRGFTLCAAGDCPLYASGEMFDGKTLPPLPDGADPNLCWRHQDPALRAKVRAQRAKEHAEWLASGVMQRTREDLRQRLEEVEE